MRPLHPVYRRIYRGSRYTQAVSLPADYLRRHGLEEGDEVEMHEQEDGSVLLRFLKHPQLETAS
jgi:antitoxin component of MazEF toxin-antitoxin module